MSEEKKRVGAPLGNQNNAKENPKTEVIRLRVTATQKEEFKERAGSKNLSEWILEKLESD